MKILRKILAVVLVLLTVVVENADAKMRQHLVQPGQTLFSIAKAYGVTIEAIQKANPSIQGTNIPTGMKLNIPEATMTPVPMPLVPEVKIQTPAEKMKSKQFTSNIKYKGSPAAKTWCNAGDGHWSDGVLNVAVILPFNLDASNTSDNKTQMRSVEFYEGVLMAIDEMQLNGRRLQVQAYDLTTASLYNILGEKSLLEADIVIAPMEDSDVRQVADWGQQHGTPVISPFSFNSELLTGYEHLFQINTQKSMYYSQLTSDLLERFQGYTFVFLTDSIARKVDPYPAQLKQELRKSGIRYKEMSYLRPEMLMACDSILGLKDDNILFVPVTPQPDAMRRMFSGLQHVKILRNARYQEAMTQGKAKSFFQPKLSVLGYPEWALNTNEFIKYYYDLDVYMFSKVYANPFDSSLKEFYNNFKIWFGKEPMSLMPKYGILGYDVTKYFLQALSRNGKNLEDRIEMQGEDGLQTNFCFERSSGGGFFNRGFYLVHFTPSSTIEKIALQ